MIACICFAVLFSVSDLLVFCSCKDVLNANVNNKMISIPVHCYPWQLAYSNVVIAVVDTNQGFHFLGIGENVPPVLLQIEVALLNKYFSQNMKIKSLFIDIESLSTFIELVENSAIKKIEVFL